MLVQKLLTFCGNTKTCNKFSKGTEEMQQTRNSGVFLFGEKHLYLKLFCSTDQLGTMISMRDILSGPA